MNIKLKLRELLIEGAHVGNKFGCVMVFLTVDKTSWGQMQDIIDIDDLYEPKGESGYGKEIDPHVTILYGLHKEVSDKEIESEVNKINNPSIKLGNITVFPNPKFDVIKYDVVSSDLHKLNKEFSKYPFTTDFPNYHPHCTIAYLKPGTSGKYLDKLNEFKTINATPEKIVYSKTNGEKIEYSL